MDISKEIFQKYTEGNCHILALALHRLYGWDLALVMDASEDILLDTGELSNTIIHVYAIDRENNLYDIRGKLESDDAIINTIDLDLILHTDDLIVEYCESEDLLQDFVSDSGPLISYTDEDLEEAMEIAKNLVENSYSYHFTR